MQVYLTNFRQIAPDHPSLIACGVHADVYSMDDNNELLLSATLEYIARTIEEREWELVMINDKPVRQSHGATETTLD